MCCTATHRGKIWHGNHNIIQMTSSIAHPLCLYPFFVHHKYRQSTDGTIYTPYTTKNHLKFNLMEQRLEWMREGAAPKLVIFKTQIRSHCKYQDVYIDIKSLLIKLESVQTVFVCCIKRQLLKYDLHNMPKWLKPHQFKAHHPLALCKIVTILSVI